VSQFTVPKLHHGNLFKTGAVGDWKHFSKRNGKSPQGTGDFRIDKDIKLTVRGLRVEGKGHKN